MNWTTRKVVVGIGAGALALALATEANAQNYPNKRITFVVGFAAGGFADSVSRIVGQHVGKTLGQTVVVENRAGAGSNIAARAVASAPADGYTVLASTTSLAVNATLNTKLDYSLVNDLIPVAVAVRAPETFTANPGRPKTLKEFLAASKSTKYTFGSSGVGSGSHLTWFSFLKDVAKVEVDHVPFNGGAPAMQATIGGQIDSLAATASGSVVAQIAEGKLTCLAVASAKRYEYLPNCPTVAESGFPTFEGSSWVGFWVPKGTPADIVAALNKAINSVADDPQAADNLKKNGDLSRLSVKEVDEFVRSEISTWGVRVKSANVQVD